MAAEEAGVSRIFGGIHFDDGNREGLVCGKIIGENAYMKACGQWKNHSNARNYIS